VHAITNNIHLDRITVKDGLSQGTVNTILQDNRGFMWLGTQNGINIYDGYTFKQLNGPDGDFQNFSVLDFMQDSKGLMWINLYSKGLYTYNPSNGHYQHILSHAPTNKDYYIIDVKEDENSGYWIATSKTLLFYQPSSGVIEQVLDLSTELSNRDNVFEIATHNNILYLATRGGVFAYNIKTKMTRKLPDISHSSANSNSYHFKEANKAFTIYISDDDELFIGSNDGIFSLDVKGMHQYIIDGKELPLYQLLIEGISSWKFLADKEKLYIGSHDGLFVINTTNHDFNYLFSYSDVFDDISDNIISSLFKDSSGMFWLGTNSTGLYQWQPQRELITNFRYQQNNVASLSSNEIWGMSPHNKNSDLFWVGTSNGLNLVDNEAHTVEQYIVNLDAKAHYTSSHIYEIIEDSQGRLILTTPKGVRVFDTKSKKIVTSPFKHDVATILKSEQVSIKLDKSDNLWTVSSEGIYKISLTTDHIDYLPEITQQVPADKIYNLLGFLPDSSLFLFSTNNALWGFDNITREVKRLYHHKGVQATEYAYIDNWVIDDNILWLSYTTKGLLGLELPSFNAKFFFHQGNSEIDSDLYGLQLDNNGDVWFSTHSGIYVLNKESHHLRKFTKNHGLVASEFNGLSYTALANGELVYGSMGGISIFNPLKLKNAHSKKNTPVKITNIKILSRELAYPLLKSVENINLQYDDFGIRIDFSTFSYAESDNIQFEYTLSGTKTINYPLTYENHITFPSLPSGSHKLIVRAKSPMTGEFSQPTQLHIKVSYAPWASPDAYLIYTIVILSGLGFWLHRRSIQRKKLLRSHEEVKYRENRLQLALTGSNSEVWDWQADKNLTFAKRGASELGYADLASSYHFTQHVELIHPDDKEGFLAKWQNFILAKDMNKNFSCTYRLKSAAGQWLWYKDLGKIVALSKEGNPTRITGSYTNITASRATEERALYYGDAFKQTKDWVLIISENFTRVIANKSLRDVFGWPEEEFKFSSNLFGLDRDRKRYYKEILSTLKDNGYWRGEELIKADDGQEYHVIIKINVSRNKANNSLHYICIFTDISAQKMAEQELRYLANYDFLTNLPNRSLLLERIKHAMAFSTRKKQSIALFFIDLDRFKHINDTLGHDYGDMLLKEITNRLTKTLRVDDTVARIGGDEFVVLLETFKGNSQLGNIAQKIIHAVEQPVILNENTMSVGASIGISLYPDDANDSDELLRNADVAMYHAKQLGRNTFQFFTPRMNYEASVRIKTENNLQLAHQNDEFINHYQPIVDSSIGKTKGVELLMRRQTKSGLEHPLSFISIAEELGLIIPMTEMALERGFADLKKWRELRPTLFLSVNLSAQHFSKDNFVSYITQLLNDNELPADALELEITENVLCTEPEKSLKTLRALSKLGVSLALDDFGTGYTSMSYLKKIPLDVIKIDRTFISDIGTDSASEAIIKATIVLAKSLNIRCIAEGVETKAQLDYLAERKCHFIQGYLYSKPIAESEISKMLEVDSAGLLAF